VVPPGQIGFGVALAATLIVGDAATATLTAEGAEVQPAREAVKL
jgi:hypothetical protein